MDDRWAYPIPMTMQRQAGSALKPRNIESPPVAPCTVPSETAAERGSAKEAAESEIRFNT
ncbi:MAG: hypothetical protein JSR72_12545 [Proteobacteria bacterium]|nr:hypothetical protein [Pseudomonadota bacterium]